MRHSTKQIWLVVTVLLLTQSAVSCASRMVIDAIERAKVCKIFAPIGWSSKDTDQTILEVKTHNAAWKRTCK
jgi:hypothetical protein